MQRQVKSKGWLAVHCQLCGHHFDCHGDWGECHECMTVNPADNGPCADGEEEDSGQAVV